MKLFFVAVKFSRGHRKATAARPESVKSSVMNCSKHTARCDAVNALLTAVYRSSFTTEGFAMEPCYSHPAGEFVVFHPHSSPLPFLAVPPFVSLYRIKQFSKKPCYQRAGSFPEAWVLNTSHNVNQFIDNKGT